MGLSLVWAQSSMRIRSGNCPRGGYISLSIIGTLTRGKVMQKQKQKQKCGATANCTSNFVAHIALVSKQPLRPSERCRLSSLMSSTLRGSSETMVGCRCSRLTRRRRLDVSQMAIMTLILIPVPILVLIPIPPVVELLLFRLLPLALAGCSSLARAAAVAVGAVTSNGRNE